MDWFEKLTGFREGAYEETRARLEVTGGRLRSRENGSGWRIGTLELVSLESLRARAHAARLPGLLRVSMVEGDVRRLHRHAENAGALFQVASQFNLLEMVSPSVTPEDGVARYERDYTQGPACAIAAGAATIYRNYFTPMNGGSGQTATRQIDTLACLGAALSRALRRPLSKLWRMRNGYALLTESGLAAISSHIQGLPEAERDTLRGKLCIGLHQDVEVTDAEGPERPVVSQAFCSALPVSYCGLHGAPWQPFASLVLEAAYEATLWAAVVNAERGASRRVFLTLLGGGAFGNDPAWILAAMHRALTLAENFGLDVRIVSYGPPSAGLLALEDDLC